MASINRSDMSSDRRGHAGKGDLFQGTLKDYRNAEVFGRSQCCGGPVVHICGKDYCEECSKETHRIKSFMDNKYVAEEYKTGLPGDWDIPEKNIDHIKKPSGKGYEEHFLGDFSPEKESKYSGWDLSKKGIDGIEKLSGKDYKKQFLGDFSPEKESK